MLRYILTSWNCGDPFISSCTLALTALILYHGIPFFQKLVSERAQRAKKTPLLRKQMTPVGKFALLSQTERNPSIISFFIALANKDEGMGIEEFEELWETVMKKHERFQYHVTAADKCSPIDVTDQPWEVSLSSGPIGTSGAILNSKELIQQGYKSETIALFRVHHAVCDGVSLSAVVKDVSDEADQLNELMIDAIEKYKMHARKASCQVERPLQRVQL